MTFREDLLHSGHKRSYTTKS